jgi:DNA-binding response OmpR family regulator
MRIRRVLSRMDNFSYAAGPLLQICDSLKVNYVQQQVVVGEDERHLTPTENALLQVLIKHRGHVVDADTLIERVWRTGVSIQDRNSLRVHMHRLRQKLEREPDDPGLIQTERGIGYVFTDC